MRKPTARKGAEAFCLDTGWNWGDGSRLINLQYILILENIAEVLADNFLAWAISDN